MIPSLFKSVLRAACTLLCASSLSGALSAQLVNGGSIDGAITTSGGQDVFSFSAQAGERFVLRVVDTNVTGFFPVVTVRDPLGNVLVSDADGNVASVGAAAPLDGSYQVVVSDGNSTPQTGAYRIHFVRAPGANEGGALPIGGTVSSSIERGDLDSYTFSMVAGENYLLRAADVAATGLFLGVAIYDPTGAFVQQDFDGRVASVGGQADRTGTYTAVVLDGNSSPSGTGAYDLHFVRTPGANSGGALTSGSIVSANLGLGELDSYTFAMQAGESFQLRASDTNATGMFITMLLYDPRGCFVASDADGRVAALGGAAEFTGNYTLVVRDGNSSPSGTGAYNLHFAKAPGQTSNGVLTSGGSVSDAVGLGELDGYTFDIQAGESFQIRANDTAGTGLFITLRLYDPRGCFVASDADGAVAALGGVAGFSGSYTVLVSDGNSSPSAIGDYTLWFARLPGAGQGRPLANGSSRTGFLESGELESFTFDIEAGESYFVRFVDSLGSGMFPVVRLYDPRGEFVASDGDSTVAALAGEAQFSGTYTVLLADGNSSPSASGAFEVHLMRAPGANEGGYLLDGVPGSGTIDLGDLDTFTFRASAGQSVVVTFTDTMGTSMFPVVRVYDPLGRFVVSDGDSTVATRAFVTAIGGTYTVLLADGNSSPTGTGDYTIQVDGAGVPGNSGCDREGATLANGPISASAGFTIRAPEFTRTCVGPSFVLLGTGAPAPVLLPNGLSCGICGLAVTAVFVSSAGDLVVPPLPVGSVGQTFLTQALCSTVPCLTLSAASEWTVLE